MFNRLNKLSGIGNAFFDSLSLGGVTPPLYPPYGTVLSSLDDIDYAETGPQATIEGVDYYGNFGDLFTYADGEGGSFNQWNNIEPYPQGTIFCSVPVSNSVYICPDSVCGDWAYQSGTYDYFWLGDGVNYGSAFMGTSFVYGDEITRDTIFTPDTSSSYIEIPPSSNSYWASMCYIQGYYYDGAQGYYTSAIPESIGQFFPAETPVGVEEPDMLFIPELENGGSSPYWPNGRYLPYLWDGLGGYYIGNVTGSYALSGTTITSVSDSSPYQVYISEIDQYYSNGKYDLTSYLHNGTGGYYTTSNTGLGSYMPSGYVYNWIEYSPIIDGGTQVLLPDGNLYWNMRQVDLYLANGSGGYTAYFGVFIYYSLYQYIMEFEGITYYWDGNGGYISNA